MRPWPHAYVGLALIVVGAGLAAFGMKDLRRLVDLVALILIICSAIAGIYRSKSKPPKL
jgi:type IV secretory pathway VirB2 component (pilin)